MNLCFINRLHCCLYYIQAAKHLYPVDINNAFARYSHYPWRPKSKQIECRQNILQVCPLRLENQRRERAYKETTPWFLGS